MIITVKDKDPRREEVLKKMVPIIRKICSKLRYLYPGALLPQLITLRTLQNRPFKRNMALMRIGKDNAGEWFIAVRKTLEDGKAVKHNLTHEIAHMGAIRMKNYWGHGKVWQDIYDHLRNNKGEVVLGDLLISFIIWGWLIFGVLKLLGKLL